MSKKEFTSINAEYLIDIINEEGLDALLKLMELRVEKLGLSILHEDLQKKQFAQVGVSLAKYQGALDLLNFTKRELDKYQKQSLQTK